MRVHIINEVNTGDPAITKEWELCFQWCLYLEDDGESYNGYRFIWRRPNGHLQPARGQARIPSIKMARELLAMAEKEGWGNHEADS